MALIAGNTLTDLSRNSLIEDAARQGAYENAMNRARRAYEYGNLSAQDRERTNQLAASLGVQRELGMGDLGVRSRDADVREKIGMGEIGVRGRGVDVQEKLGLGQLENLKAQLEWQKKYLESGGDTRMPALIAANRANQLFRDEKSMALGELIEKLDTPLTFRENAIRVANDIIAGKPVPSWAEKAKLWYDTQRLPMARQRIGEALGDAGGVVSQVTDSLGNELYVPAFGRGQPQAQAQPAPVNNLAAATQPVVPNVTRFVRGPNGALVREGATPPAVTQQPNQLARTPAQRSQPGLGASAWFEGITGYSPSQVGNAALSGLGDISRFWTGYTPEEVGSAAVNNLANSYIGAYDTASESARAARDTIAGKLRSANPFLPDFWMENNAQPTAPARPVNWFGMGGY